MLDTKGLTGLKNLGNTCFLNSCLQILKHTYGMTDILKTSRRNNIVDSVLLTEWINLEKILWNNNTIVSPDRFVSSVQYVAKTISIALFTGWSRKDMPEFLLFMIECIHNSISRPVKITIKSIQQNNTDKNAMLCYKLIQEYYEKVYSEIMDLFYAIHLSEIISFDTLEVLSTKPEFFFILDLPIPKIKNRITLFDCFNELSRNELLDGANSWYNETSKKYQKVYKKRTFWSLLKVLVITLNRFSPCGTKKFNKMING